MHGNERFNLKKSTSSPSVMGAKRFSRLGDNMTVNENVLEKLSVGMLVKFILKCRILSRLWILPVPFHCFKT